MDNSNIPADFITNWFTHKGAQYKIAYSPEFQISRGELDFTGNFIGILISSNKGTQSFLEDKHPDKIFECLKYPLIDAPLDFPQQLILRSFEYGGDIYKLAITPEFGNWEENQELDFSGCYEGILVSCKTGTLMFQVEPSGEDFETIGEGIEPGLGNMISNVIKEFRPQATMA